MPNYNVQPCGGGSQEVWDIPTSVIPTGNIVNNQTSVIDNPNQHTCYVIVSGAIGQQPTSTATNAYDNCEKCSQSTPSSSPTPTPTLTQTPTVTPSSSSRYYLSLRSCCDNQNISPSSPFDFVSVGEPINNESVITYLGECYL